VFVLNRLVSDKMKRVILALSVLLCAGLSAYAQNSNQGRVVSNCGTAGITYTVGGFGPMTVDTNGNLCFNGSGSGVATVVTGSGTAGTPATGVLSIQGITGMFPVTVSGYDSGAITATATPANASHAAGTSVGGLFSIALARVNGGSGILTNIGYKSTGGSTGVLAVRIWQKNPTGTTCTDNTAFVGADADDANLIAPPFSITPSAPASTTGDSATYGQLQTITWDYKNSDTSPGQNLYLCAVTVATDTADENKLVRWTLSGPQN
jgi:hypothetical protein